MFYLKCISVGMEASGVDVQVPFLSGHPNLSQKQAVATALTNDFTLIQGPPGLHFTLFLSSGRTLVHYIFHVHSTIQHVSFV